MTKRTGTALVTGASAGIGAAFCRELATRGHRLVVVARNEKRLGDLAGELVSLGASGVEILPADLANRTAVDEVADRLADYEFPVDLLVNNAGFGISTAFLSTPVEEEERALDVMVRAVLVLSRAAALAMRARGRGAIVNVSSIAAFAPVGTYAAAKSWVRFFTEALSMELEGTGVTATALCPGFVHTEFHERGDFTTDRIPDAAWLEADRVVQECLRDVDRGKAVSVPSKRYRTLAGASHATPLSLIRRIGKTSRDISFS